jgi:hypothetical protein
MSSGIVGGPTLRVIELVKLFRTGRRLTINQAADVLETHPEIVRGYIYGLHDAGLLRICAWERPKKQLVRVYEWCEVFGTADEPQPRLKVPA